MCQPYIQHCAAAKNISMPWNTPGPQSPSGKKDMSNRKGSTRLFSYSDLKGFGQIDTYKHFPYTERILLFLSTGSGSLDIKSQISVWATNRVKIKSPVRQTVQI